MPAAPSRTQAPSSEAPVYSEGLAALRGIAALTVVVYHSLKVFRVGAYDDPYSLSLAWGDGWLFLSQAQLVLFNGRSAVTLFFVLSGAVLTMSLLRETRLGAPELTAYWIKRGFRLYPLLVAVTLFAEALDWGFFETSAQDAMTSWAARRYQHDPPAWEVLTNAIGYRNTLNPPSWTIYIEIVASLAFPLLFLALTSRVATVLTGFALAALMAAPFPALRLADVFLISFFVGGLIPLYARPFAEAFLRIPRPARYGAIALVLLTMGGFNQVYSPDFVGDPVRVLVETGCAAFIVCIVYFAPPPPLFRSRALRALGDLSYGVYLLHFGVLFVLAHLVAPPPGVTLTPGEALANNIALALATVTVTIPLAALAHHGLERPFQDIGRRLAGRIVADRRFRAAERTLLGERAFPVRRPLPLRVRARRRDERFFSG